MRRVAISLRVLDFAYEHDTRSVFADFDAMRGQPARPHPLTGAGRRRGTDRFGGDPRLARSDRRARACPLAPGGIERRRALHRIELAAGAIDKIGAAAYERMIRPAALRWPEWIDRCRTQGAGALAALAADPWPASERLDQVQITIACMLRYVHMADPDLLPPGRFPTLDALSTHCEALPAFQATWPRSTCSPRTREGRL